MALTYEGYARIRFENFEWRHEWDLDAEVEPRPKQVAKLVKVFEAERCKNEAADNVINAVVRFDPGESEKIKWKKRPELNHAFLDKKAFCLDGLHRVAAARQFLLSGEQWWTVRVYDAKYISQKTATQIIEKYSHEQAFRDGTIFRKILIYHRKNAISEAKWWARLSPTKTSDLRQLLKNIHIADAFEACVKYKSLWAPIQLGSLHRLNTLKCDEVISSTGCIVEIVLKLDRK
jgi:hypothetical protein